MDLKVLTLLLMISFISVETYREKTSTDRLQALTIENQQLKYSNATIQRAKSLPKSGGVDYEAVRKASYLTLAPMAYIAAVRLHENGGQGLELGHHGKTQYAIEHGTIQQQQYIDGARTLTKFAWEYCDQSPGCLEYLASRYTGPPQRSTELGVDRSAPWNFGKEKNLRP